MRCESIKAVFIDIIRAISRSELLEEVAKRRRKKKGRKNEKLSGMLQRHKNYNQKTMARNGEIYFRHTFLLDIFHLTS
jgi:hypothetical protein